MTKTKETSPLVLTIKTSDIEKYLKWEGSFSMSKKEKKKLISPINNEDLNWLEIKISHPISSQDAFFTELSYFLRQIKDHKDFLLEKDAKTKRNK